MSATIQSLISTPTEPGTATTTPSNTKPNMNSADELAPYGRNDLILSELERWAQQLWTFEPECSTDDRHVLLDQLRSVTIDVERLGFRASFRADEPISTDALRSARAELIRLARHWPETHGAALGAAIT